MKRSIRIWEGVKTALIVLLLCSALLLASSLISELASGQSLLQRAGSALGWFSAEPAYVPTTERYASAADPLAISMTGGNGRGSTVGEPERTAALYDSLGRGLGEALATAGMPVALPEADWLALLRGESVSVRYPGEIPLDSLARWLGAEPSGALSGVSASLVTLCIDGAQVSLLLRSESLWLCMSTALNPEALRQTLESCRPDGSLFAMEDETLSQLDPLSLLTVSAVLPEATGENALTDGDRINAAATLLGLNPYRDTALSDANGTVSISGATGRMRVTAAGILRYTAAETRAAARSTTALIEDARALLAQLNPGGDAALQLSSCTEEDGTVVLCFDYVLSGYRVRLPDGSAATLRYEGGTLADLTWTARRYTLTGVSQTLWPARVAAAVVAPGTLLEPLYEDNGGTLTCGWPAE